MYQTKAADQVSRYRPHLDQSLTWIAQSEVNRAAAIIDVGGGEAMLVDDLPAQGYQDITVLDISSAALAVARERLGDRALPVGTGTGRALAGACRADPGREHGTLRRGWAADCGCGLAQGSGPVAVTMRVMAFWR